MEKKKIGNSYRMIWCAMILLQVFVIIFWGNVKEGFFIDELYTLEGAQKSGYDIGLNMDGYKWQTEPNFFETWHESDEFIEHVTVHKSDWVFYGPFVQGIKKFLSNPYYVLINIVSCANFGNFSKWYAIGFNIFLFVLAQIILHQLILKVSNSKKDAFMVNMLYGFSAGAISTAIFVRFYMLSVLMTIITAYVLYLLWNNKDNIKKEIAEIFLLLAVIYLGYRVHQYILVWSAVLCLVYVCALISKREWKKLTAYMGIFIVAGIGYLSKNSISDMLSGKQGEAAVENLFHKPIVNTIKDIASYIATIVEQVLGNKYFCIAVFVIAFIYLFLRKRKKIYETITIKEKFAMIVIVCVAMYILIIGRICPWVSWRYVSNIFPMVVLGVYMIVSSIIERCFDEKKAWIAVSIYFFISLCLSYNVNVIKELHLGARSEAMTLATGYADVDSIFVYDGNEGRLYLNSYIYAPNTRVFITEKSTFDENTIFDAEEQVPDEILVWVSAVNEDYKDTVNYFVEHSSYKQSELLLDRSRHNECYYVYLLK
ncbi:MAG: hypothetical protein J6D08_06660 [Lachnospiraceae bacterium]|nr:hypothetical protein [Lachnospiraceae bacterium]